MSDQRELGRTMADTRVPTFAVVHGKRTIPLPNGELLIGRGTDCHVVLDSAMVSRRHAKLVVDDAQVLLVDLGSVNGVKVDSIAVKGQATLALGARISIADELLQLVRLDDERRKSITAPELRRANTIDVKIAEADEEATLARRRQDRFDLLSGLVDKALALRRGADAEQLLSGALAEVAGDARAKRPVSPALSEKAALYALRLADATNKAGWLDYVIKLFSDLSRPLPLELVDHMHVLFRRIPGVSRAALESYVHKLNATSLPPAERFAVRRLEGLLRVLSS